MTRPSLRRAPTRETCDAPGQLLIPLQRLIDGIRQPRARADEVADVRTRLTDARRKHEKSGDDASRAATREIARDLAKQRVALAAAFGEVRSCAGCARGRSLPSGRWDGGHCCSGHTAEVFTDYEVLALALAGTTPSKLVAPAGDHSGCAFRGEAGCSLNVVDRPSICVRYACLELEGELAESGALGDVKKLSTEMVATVARFRTSIGGT